VASIRFELPLHIRALRDKQGLRRVSFRRISSGQGLSPRSVSHPPLSYSESPCSGISSHTHSTVVPDISPPPRPEKALLRGEANKPQDRLALSPEVHTWWERALAVITHVRPTKDHKHTPSVEEIRFAQQVAITLSRKHDAPTWPWGPSKSRSQSMSASPLSNCNPIIPRVGLGARLANVFSRRLMLSRHMPMVS
jgi:hypothetical protein